LKSHSQRAPNNATEARLQAGYRYTLRSMATSSQRFTGSAALAISTALKVFDDPPVDFDKYDICLEFPVDTVTNKLNPIGTEVMNQLISIFGSKYVSLFYSKDTSKIYALIRAALKLVRTKAEIDRFKLLLDANAAKNRAFDGDEEARVNGFSIPHVPEVSPIEPFRFIYGEYITRPDAQELYYKEEGSSHPFTKLVRIKLMSRILHATRSTEGEYRMSLEYLRLGGVILDFNAVHEPQALEELRERWLSVFFVPWGQPFGLIKNYFGEKMGFYFYFLGKCALLAVYSCCMAFTASCCTLVMCRLPELLVSVTGAGWGSV
jgi:hypothetical protein